MAEEIIHYEDYVLGHERTTTGRTITETDFVVHAGHTGDFFPHHMDAEFAKTLPGGHRIAHGTMIFAIGVGLTATLINPVAFSYGYDRLRFIRPVHIGDTIRSVSTSGASAGGGESTPAAVTTSTSGGGGAGGGGGEGESEGGDGGGGGGDD